MHGGVKVYRGAPAAARNYLEADRCRADDYYLAESTGLARRFTVDADGRVVELAAMGGDDYEAWVAGVDPDTGEPRGRVRQDPRAVRFVEVTVNGPKSWSLAAELHPDVGAAYDAAQERAAAQIIAWLGQHATARVGPRGAQVAAPVQRLEAAVIRHYTSRAGDPHRHLHLQINARVFAAGRWRGIDTVAVRDSIGAINGIGHAAVACDPGFRAALAVHGYTLTAGGEIEQLAEYVGPFSRRAAQIGANIGRYEADWRAKHPGREPGAAQRRGWDARAWAEDRPDKVSPQSGAQVHERWLDELATLGYRDPERPVQLALPLSGQVDRAAAVVEVLARLGAARSAWNAADVRGEVEQLIARQQLVAGPGVRAELAEDLTARALELCVPLREPAPEHLRALTSRHVLDVEADIESRFAARGAEPGVPIPFTLDPPGGRDRGLDAGQRAAVGVLTGTAPLVVIEGAAGAGKTTMLAAARHELDQHGRRLVVVTPTLKAAQAAAKQIGARAGSAAGLAFQHGWRWDDAGRWSRLEVGDRDLVTGHVHSGPGAGAELGAGDVLLVDEAGMLDQGTALALLTLADEHGARIALVGDRQQLPAVGRGGVLELAHRWADPGACITLEAIHRFSRETAALDGGKTMRVPDAEYAALTLAMRCGEDPDQVFDALQHSGHIRVHAGAGERDAAIAEAVISARAAGRTVAAVLDTREQVAALNSVIRDRLVAAGLVEDRDTASTLAGQLVGRGDTIATRRNDHDLRVANRDTWTVTHVHPDGALTVTGEAGRQVQLPGHYVRKYVELAYAGTAHSAQGTTTTTAHLLLGEHTSAAAAYVALTRGRHANTAHLIATDLDDAREQWSAAFARDRADLGPAHARAAAERDAARYATPRPISEVIAELREAWDQQADTELALRRLNPALERALAAQPRVAAEQAARDRADARIETAQRDLERARAQLAASDQAIAQTGSSIEEQLRRRWDSQRGTAQSDARRIQAGTGRLGRGRADIAAATIRLEEWANQWEPIVGDLCRHWSGLVGFAAAHPGNDHISQPLHEHAQRAAELAHPEHAAYAHAVDQAQQRSRAAYDHAYRLSQDTTRHSRSDDRLATLDNIATLRDGIAAGERQLADADQRLATLRADPAITGRPDSDTWLGAQHANWHTERTHRDTEDEVRRAARQHQLDPIGQHQLGQLTSPGWQPSPLEHGPSIGL